MQTMHPYPFTLSRALLLGFRIEDLDEGSDQGVAKRSTLVAVRLK